MVGEMIIRQVCLAFAKIPTEEAFSVVHTCWMQLSDSWVSIGLDLMDHYMYIDRSKALIIKDALDTSRAYSETNTEATFNRFISSYRKSLEQGNSYDLLPTLVNWAMSLFARTQRQHTYKNVKDNLFWLIETTTEADWK